MIPVIINNRDIDPRPLINQIKRFQELGELHLIDNASTYPRTVEHRDWCAWVHDGLQVGTLEPMSCDYYCPPIVHRWENCGPRAACRLVNQMRDEWTRQGVEFYATTDSDLDLSGVPADALRQFVELLSMNRGIVKVGCALRLDDLSDTPQGRLARESEAKHWHIPSIDTPRRIQAYHSDIDTTFAVYRLNPPWDGSYGPSVRIAGEYTARHLPWYHTDENRPPDYQWYLDHCDPQGTFYTAAEKAKCTL